jgi:NAD(P)H-dependent FMN reductase
MKRVLVIAGSTREGSLHKLLAQQSAAALREEGLAVSYVDLRDYPMPLYDGDLEQQQGLPEGARALKVLVREHDALVIASPEYNGSMTAVLKNAIDWVTRPEDGERPTAAIRGKVAALVSASPGPGGGRGSLRAVRQVLEYLGVNVLADEVSLARFTAGTDAGPVLREQARALRAALEGGSAAAA